MMRLVADSNVLFTFFWKNPALRGILRQDAQLFSPEHSLYEIEKHRQGIIEKTRITDDEFASLLYLMKHDVEFVPRSAYERYFADVEKLAGVFPAPERASVMKDCDFLALALLLRCPLWSNDKLLKKQSSVAVFSTREIVRLTEPVATGTTDEMLAQLEERGNKFKGKKEHIDHDLIAHGVNREGDELLPSGKIRRKC